MSAECIVYPSRGIRAAYCIYRGGAILSALVAQRSGPYKRALVFGAQINTQMEWYICGVYQLSATFVCFWNAQNMIGLKSV